MIRWYSSWAGRRGGVWRCLLLAICAGPPASVSAEVITLKCGLQLQGEPTKCSSLNQNPLTPYKSSNNVDVSKIVMLDDGLRRSFVSSNQVRAGGLAPDVGVSKVKIKIDKPVAKSGRAIGSVGPILGVTPFDEFGNRVFSMRGPRGRIDVVQGITEITPLYARVQGLSVRNAYTWDMRVSTASIPRQTLTQILLRQTDQADVQQRLRVVTLYIQAQRFRDALVELNRVIKDFPDVENLAKQRKHLFQLMVTDVIREIELRRDAGQQRLAYKMLTGFGEKDVAGELLLQVGEMIAEYDKSRASATQALELFKKHEAALAGDKSYDALKGILDEIRRELNFNNLDRLADYLRLADDEKLKVDQKIALAVSGWLLGSGAGIDNLAQSLSLVDVRGVIRAYLSSETPGDREAALQHLKELEGGTPSNLAKIIAHMKPPISTEFPQEGIPGLLRRSVRGKGAGGEIEYLIQLPPEYDPYRRYPCIVTLRGAQTTAMDQIDWWAGQFDPTSHQRLGQASRRGYVVIAPQWLPKGQTKYGYSMTEHAAVLGSLRDACRRFSIDTDRVFLSGYSIGGDAAWDIGLAHPDLWAGTLPIVATVDKYVSRYWPNGRSLPMYFVAGQLDGNKIAVNGRDLDRYLKYSGFDVLYVEYRGRGHEGFNDEIQRMFEWMELHQRDFFPKRFEVVSMRPWDQFFWWLELSGFPERSMVLPESWPEPKMKEARTEARVMANNSIWIKTAATDVTVCLSPEFVDFDRRISINGHRVDVTPKAEELLEDVRTRSDRQHPFWTRIRPRVGRRAS